MATLQIRVDDNLKTAADDLFASFGLDTSTAVRMFLAAALDSATLEGDGIPFAVKWNSNRKPNPELREAMEDVRLGRNLYGPFAAAEEAMHSLLED